MNKQSNILTDNLYDYVNYSSPIDYILDGKIIEYDIKQANISVLYSRGAIPYGLYEELRVAPKQKRQVQIGNMLKNNKELQSILSDGIRDARKALFEKLGLTSADVLAIKNDAIFIVQNSSFKYPLMDEIPITDKVRFIKKNQYRSFYKLNRKEFYYNYNPIDHMVGMDIRGLGDYAINMHKNHMICILMDMFYLAVTQGARAALSRCRDYYSKYINRELPIEFYRRFDSQSMYDLENNSEFSSYQAEFIDSPFGLNMVDISYNAGFLYKLATYYMATVLQQTMK